MTMYAVLASAGSSALHAFSRNGRELLFDPATRTSFELDSVGTSARPLPRLGPDQQGAEEEPLPTLRALPELQAAGYFQRRWLTCPPPRRNTSYSVYAILSRRCNLRCRYCYTRRMSHPAPTDMPLETMQATARFAAGLAAASALEGAGVDVSCAGEVTCHLDLYDRFAELLRDEGRRAGVQLAPRIWFGTNLTTLGRPEVADRLAELEVLACSLDGPPAAHNRMRVYPNGGRTYRDAKRGLRQLQATGRPFAVAATLTAAYPDVLAVYQHLLKLGCNSTVVKPVRAEPGQPFAIWEDLDGICHGYSGFAEWLLGLPEAELVRCLRAILHQPTSHDYFGRFLQRTMQRSLIQRRCEAWESLATVDTDGSLYACAAMAGLPKAHIGSVWEGVDETSAQDVAQTLHISHRSPCNVCWARYLCGGGCPHQSWLTHGALEPPDQSECQLNQHLIELAIWLYSELCRHRPGVLAALSEPASGPVQAPAVRIRRRSASPKPQPGKSPRSVLRGGRNATERNSAKCPGDRAPPP